MSPNILLESLVVFLISFIVGVPLVVVGVLAIDIVKDKEGS